MRDHSAEKVVVAWPYGHHESHMVQSITDLLAYDANHHRRIVEGGGRIMVGTTNVAHGRNQIVTQFLDNHDAGWLWFVDTDMAFTPDTLDRLIESADPDTKPILGALCFALMKGDAQEVVPTLYGLTDDDPPAPCRYYEIPPKPGIYQFAATGTGCLLIHRSVLVAVRDHDLPNGKTWGETSFPWFQFAPWTTPEGADVMGEDLTFCYRAAACGIAVHVDTRIEVGHVKSAVIGSAQFYGQFGQGPPVPNMVVIPVKNRRDLTEPLLKQLVEQDDAARIFVMDNGSNRQTKNWLSTLDPEWRVEVVDCAGQGISRMWNEGVRRALAVTPRCNIAILNNDLVLGDEFLSRLAAGLRSDDRVLACSANYDGRPEQGTVAVQGISAGREDGTGGLAGFAFMVRGEMFEQGFPLFDEQFAWYAGDLDMVLTVEKLGGVTALATDAHVTHIGGGSQTAGDGHKRIADPELQAVADADNARLEAKWSLTLVPAGEPAA